LGRLLVSECCAEILERQPGIRLTGRAELMQFDQVGNLLPL
jgi:hypothetical protein